jgi:hypothetical protein
MGRIEDYTRNAAEQNKILAAIAAGYHFYREYLDCLKDDRSGLIAADTLAVQ